MINAIETKGILREFAWDCYEFWTNELKVNNDAEVWSKVIMDLECITHNPFNPKGDLLDTGAKVEFIKELKMDLGI